MPSGVYPRTAETKVRSRAGMLGHQNALGYKWTEDQCARYRDIKRAPDARAIASAATRATMTPEVLALRSALLTKHGEAHKGAQTPTWMTWTRMNQRCNNPNAPNYKHYGGRGIQMLYPSVLDILADIGEKPGPEYCIHRLDSDGDYEPGNCVWMLKSEHARLHGQQRREARAKGNGHYPSEQERADG